MEEPGQPGLPPAIEPESSRFWRRLLPWITTAAVLIVYILVKLLFFVNPEWLAMYQERRSTMATPGGARKAPDPSLLADFPAMPTGWHGAPDSPVSRPVAADSMVSEPRHRRLYSCSDRYLFA